MSSTPQTNARASESRRRAEAELIDVLGKSPAARDLLEQLLRQRVAVPPSSPAAAAPEHPAPVERAASLAFSFIFFAGSAGRDAAEKYDLLHHLARFGDEHGFDAVWIPERHFHPFGGIYSSPVVMAASLARLTHRIRLRAGSVVLPLHHPVTVAETWATVDQLSGGRVDLAFASGWNPNDFVISPDTFPRLRDVWLERIETVRQLWRGDELSLPNGKGEPYPVAIFPRPVQPELPVWLTVTSRDDSFIEAGRRGYNVLTMLKGISVEELGRKVGLYRDARAAAGHDRAAGIVSLMLHALVHPDGEWVRSRTAESFGEYIKSGLSGHVQAVGAGERPDDAATQKIVEYAAERYSQRAALFGTPDECRAMAESVQAVGVNEIALLMDFGVDAESVKASLPHLLTLKRAFDPSTPSLPLVLREQAGAVAVAVAVETTPPRRVSEPIAVVGMSGRFPGSPDVDTFWTHLRDGHELIADIPAARWDAGATRGSRRAGLLDELDRFDAAEFRITNREASSMDPHQRLFLDSVARALDDAGYQAETLAGSRTGVFVAAYNADFTVRAATGQVPLDAYTATGSSLFMVANRVSHVFDLRGPSEVVNTACSSALVALHRAVQALRHGECDMAIAGGVSLLLSMGRLAGLDQYGILSPEGRCRPFDRRTTGQVIGEGSGALVLKTLSAAQRDGDTIAGLIRGSAVNHHGNRSGSPTLPDVHAQADVILDACRDAGLSFDEVDYIEAHGTGGFGDIVELEAFKRADTLTRAAGGPARARASCPVGTLKPNIGFLEAAGGISQAIKVLLMLRHRTIAPTLNHESCPEEVALDETPFDIATRARPWLTRSGEAGAERPRRASVHAYGLGGTNAHVVFEEAPPRAIDDARSRGEGPWVREMAIAPESPVVADHRVDGRGVVPGVAYLELAAQTCQSQLRGRPWRYENVFWIAPCVVGEAGKRLRCTARRTPEGSLFFEVTDARADGAELLATGHIVCSAAPATAPAATGMGKGDPGLEASAIARSESMTVLSAGEIYGGRTAAPVHYGPGFRAIEEARVSQDLVVATLLRPAGEAPDALVSRGLLEGAFQSAQLFTGGGAALEVFMPFSVDAIEIHGPNVPDRCRAVVTRHDGGVGVMDDGYEGRFDATLWSDGRPWAVVRNFCARREADRARESGGTAVAGTGGAIDVEHTLADLAAGRLTVDEAERRLSAAATAASRPRAAGEALQQPLRSDADLLNGLRDIVRRVGRAEEAGDLRLRTRRDGDDRDVVALAMPSGTVTLRRADLQGLLDARLDPGVLSIDGRLQFDPPDALFAREFGDLFFRHYNTTHCERGAVGGFITELYRTGIVSASTGERRAIYPWAVPAVVGLELARLIRARGCTRTLEVGMAYGLATLFVCEAHRTRGRGRHIAIDPHQQLEFLGIGLRNVERAGLSPFFAFMEAEDARALPELERRGERFDLVFIDGLHMFDYTLLDFFYADRLLAVGGCVVFDDAQAPGVRRALDFIERNRGYRALDVGIERIAVLEKLEEDARSLVNPNDYRPF